MLHIYEHPESGVMFQVDYTPAQDTEDGKVQLNEVRVYDAAYAACGPSLLHFMHNSYVLNTLTHPAVASSLLNSIAEEIKCLKLKN